MASRGNGLAAAPEPACTAARVGGPGERAPTRQRTWARLLRRGIEKARVPEQQRRAPREDRPRGEVVLQHDDERGCDEQCGEGEAGVSGARVHDEAWRGRVTPNAGERAF